LTVATDVIEVQAATDVDVGPGGIFRADLRSGGGRDRVDFNYRGSLTAPCRSCSMADWATMACPPSSSGRGAPTPAARALVPSVVLGGPGRDAVVFLVVKSSADPLGLFATLDGGPGFDFGTHTSNVPTVRIERDILA
jgi:hypothetical protein